ncbi:late cornified envelope protein 3C-like [Talpa occidentalis]|uniref:late cornified envelope protein 3C-like n=1 Tax=Talpa occidentalis TaxID=50954 RepID=UPI00188F471F|nr:late cornified envelope protein 3C-like [Talpa occidentalis]
MSCQQNQQQCQPPPKSPTPKCPLRSPAQCLPPPASSGCTPSSGVCHGPSSGANCCLSPHGGHRSHRGRRSYGCRRQSSSNSDRASGQQ